MPKYNVIPFPHLAGGLDSTLSLQSMPAEASGDLQNMTIREADVIAKRWGLERVGHNNLDGLPLLIDQYFKLNGSGWLVAVTTTGFFYFDPETDTWVDISPEGGLHGTAVDIPSADIVNDIYIFTNGVDPIMQWNGGILPAQPLPNTDFKGKVVRGFYAHLLVGGIDTDPQTVVWTRQGTIDDWYGPTSGAVQLRQGADWIVTMERMGDQLVVYKERSVVAATYVGDPEIFRFDEVVSGIGLPARRAIANLGNEHIFFGWDNIYSYSGGRSVDPIGSKLQQDILRNLDPKQVSKIIGLIIEELNEIWFLVPSPGSEYPDLIWVWNYEHNRWIKNQMTATAVGFWERTNDITIGKVEGTIGASQLRIGDRSFLSASPITVFTEPDGAAYMYTDTQSSDAGTPIVAYLETKEFVGESGSRLARWMALEIEALGTTMEVYYRADRGPWQFAAEVQLKSTWDRYKVDIDVTAKSIQFLFSQADPEGQLQLRGGQVLYVTGGVI